MSKPILSPDNDIIIERAHGPLCMLGPSGAERELSFVKNVDFNNHLPVLIGTGLGHSLKFILKNYKGPMAIVDKEKEIQKLTQVLEQLSQKDRARIYLIDNSKTEDVLRKLTIWQNKNNYLPLQAIVHPFYLRLDKEWYGHIRSHVQASQNVDFWSRARKPRFGNKSPRVLLITSKYFLMGEVAQACKRLNIEHELLTLPDECMASNEFIENLLSAVIKFQPDCLLTLNHLGVDREGVLIELLERLQLPLASWFVDNPHLVMHLYNNLKSPWVSIFTWDYDNISSLKSIGFDNVFYLPLGTDPMHFEPNNKGKAQWKSPVSFVGNSMHFKVESRLAKEPLPDNILEHFYEIAQGFDHSPIHSVANFIKAEHPKTFALYENLENNEQRLSFETAITWEATRLYRARCVEKTFDFKPLIVGDPGWEIVFKAQRNKFNLHRELNYYSELHTFYPMSEINFNCTSKQMKGAVNQRIFDVPACNAFVLTDWREQMDALFEPEIEMISYKELEEIPELISYYLKNTSQRAKIVTAARKRVLAEHTWDNRLQSLLKDMQQVYGTKSI